MTTNGTFLPGRAADLVDAGLERVNISLDPDQFAEATETGAFDRVLDGVEAVLDAGLDPVKLNMVLLRETATQVPEMVDFVAGLEGLRLQLLQSMPELTGNPEWAVDVDESETTLEDSLPEISKETAPKRVRQTNPTSLIM